MGEEKVQINVVVMGHVNSGKSTTTGELIQKLGGSDEGVMERFEDPYEPGLTDKHVMERFHLEPAEMKKGWMSVLDRLKADHERGITALWKFESNKYDFSVIDAPVHTENMIPAMHVADCAVLMIDSTTAGFEQGMSWNGGMTRRHPPLAYKLGIDQIICCCNKMDATTPKYSKGRYKEIVKQVSCILEDVGYNPDKVPFVPISSIEGDNITERSTKLDWYKGPTLLEALDNIKKHKRPSDMPNLRRSFPKASVTQYPISDKLLMEFSMKGFTI